MLGLLLIVVLSVAVLVGSGVAARLRVPAPILLVVVGALLGVVPVLGGLELPAEVVLLLFLPPLLFFEALGTSLREIRRNLRHILLTSTLLVVVTAGVVAVVAHAFGLPWGAAWVLGAALAPTDATAVGAFAAALPRRAVTLLRAESLINDGTALTVYGLAVGAVVAQDQVSVLSVSGEFLLTYLGGAAAGIAVGWLAMRCRRFLDGPIQENVVTIVVPFAAYLLAESIGASGVLAAVLCGLAGSQHGPRTVRADTRRQAYAFWTLAAFLLNGALFVLVGIELHSAIGGLPSAEVWLALLAVLVISVVLIAVRLAFLFTSSGITLLATRRRWSPGAAGVVARASVVSGLAGFRGAVSLAAALGVPHLIGAGSGFPGRDFIVFVTAGVIVVTLVGQGAVLGRVVRWARLPHDRAPEEEGRAAESAATGVALESLPRFAAELGVERQTAATIAAEYRSSVNVLGEEPDGGARLRSDALRLRLLAVERETVVRMRDEGQIDDAVLLIVQERLDVEEVRLSRRSISDD